MMLVVSSRLARHSSLSTLDSAPISVSFMLSSSRLSGLRESWSRRPEPRTLLATSSYSSSM